MLRGPQPIAYVATIRPTRRIGDVRHTSRVASRLSLPRALGEGSAASPPAEPVGDLQRRRDHLRPLVVEPGLVQPERRAGDAHRGDDVAVRAADRCGRRREAGLELVDGQRVPDPAYLGELLDELAAGRDG